MCLRCKIYNRSPVSRYVPTHTRYQAIEKTRSLDPQTVRPDLSPQFPFPWPSVGEKRVVIETRNTVRVLSPSAPVSLQITPSRFRYVVVLPRDRHSRAFSYWQAQSRSNAITSYDYPRINVTLPRSIKRPHRRWNAAQPRFPRAMGRNASAAYRDPRHAFPSGCAVKICSNREEGFYF